jgi:hypothetical protein
MSEDRTTLDAERLARALRALTDCGPENCDHEGVEWHWTDEWAFARALAAKYAALSPLSPEKPA